MSQKLISPINKTMVTASVDTQAYKTAYKLTHCGIDMVSSAGNTTMYASGNGTVLLAGKDNVVGNVVIIKYPDVYNHKTGMSHDVVARHYHLASIAVKAGDKVTIDTKIGNYGATGKQVDGAHLHLEIDTDVSVGGYKCTPTLSGNSSLMKASPSGYRWGEAKNTCINPTQYLHRKTTSPENQTWATRNTAYIRDEDKSVPTVA